MRKSDFDNDLALQEILTRRAKSTQNPSKKNARILKEVSPEDEINFAKVYNENYFFSKSKLDPNAVKLPSATAASTDLIAT